MCLWILFAGVFFYGLVVLATGVLSVSRYKSVRGVAARLLGAGMMALPLVCFGMAILTAYIALTSGDSPQAAQMLATIASFATLFVGISIVFVSAYLTAKVHTTVGGHKKSDVDMKHLSNIDAGGEPNFNALADHDRES